MSSDPDIKKWIASQERKDARELEFIDFLHWGFRIRTEPIENYPEHIRPTIVKYLKEEDEFYKIRDAHDAAKDALDSTGNRLKEFWKANIIQQPSAVEFK